MLLQAVGSGIKVGSKVIGSIVNRARQKRAQRKAEKAERKAREAESVLAFKMPGVVGAKTNESMLEKALPAAQVVKAPNYNRLLIIGAAAAAVLFLILKRK